MRIYTIFGNSYWGKSLPPDVLDRDDSGAFAGGETHYLEGALGLAEAGYEVTCFTDLIEETDYKGVAFRPLSSLVRAIYYRDYPDIAITYMDPSPLAKLPLSTIGVFVQQCNDLGFLPGWTEHVDVIVAASANHREFLRSIEGMVIINGIAGFSKNSRAWTGPIDVVHNGCYVDRYPIEVPRNRQPLVAHWSSPDRGLHHLLRAWPYVVEKVPAARLRVYYEIKKLIDTNAGWWARASAHQDDYLYPRDPSVQGQTYQVLGRASSLRHAVMEAKRVPSIEFCGMVPRPTLRASQLETKVMCYPLDPIGEYTEGFGGSVAESLAAGALPLLCPRDAFPSLFTGVAKWIQSVEPSQLAEQIVDSFKWTGEEAPKLSDMRERAERYSWANSRKEMVRVIERAVARKRGDTVPEPAFPLESP